RCGPRRRTGATRSTRWPASAIRCARPSRSTSSTSMARSASCKRRRSRWSPARRCWRSPSLIWCRSRGIAAASAVAILAELAVLPQDMSAREWVAHAGLDPRRHESGTSVKGPVRISKVGNRHLRRALYMPTIVAVQHEPRIKALYEKLLLRGKKPMQANVAVMRKLLHAIHGMLRTVQHFDGERFLGTEV